MTIARLLLSLTLLAASGAAAHAGEPTKVAGFRLGQKARLRKPKRTRLFGCKGSLDLQSNDKGITGLFFTVDPDECANPDSPDWLARETLDTISRAMGVPPVTGTGGFLWQGKQVTVIVTRVDVGARVVPQIRVVPASVGSTSACFDDGFDKFFASFQAAVAAGKHGSALAAFFQLPVIDADQEYGNVDASRLDTLISDGEKKTIADAIDKDLLRCDLDAGSYAIPFDGEDYGELTAEKTSSGWRWTLIGSRPPTGDE